ncbi:MAG TPA: putative sulfate exporter family transporter [Symbiobacteriaceae bacterium]|nr:putative sulfate exporter family transporter [Symbiobacteriaceae bacterium]
MSSLASRPAPRLERIPGALLALAVAVFAWLVGEALPVIGAPVLAIVTGVGLSAWRAPSARLKPGLKWTAKAVLQIAIVLMGFGLSFAQVWRTGAESFVVMIGTLVVCLGAAFLIGPRMGISRNLTALIGAGTAICGASAIAAVAPVVEAEEGDLAYGISTIFLYNLTAVLLFPVLGHLLGLSMHSFGLWAGTAINDTSSVVAAAYAYGKEAGEYATVVKLSRALMIVPVSLLFAWLQRRRAVAATSTALGLAVGQTGTAGHAGAPMAPATSQVNSWRRITKVVPGFILGFVAASLLVSTGLVPALLTTWLPKLAKFLIVVALAAVGLSADLKGLRKTGPKPLLLGGILWLLVAFLSLLLQRLTGQL